MSSGSLTWADRVRGGSRATERKMVDSEKVDSTESERTERKVDGGGKGEVDGGGKGEVDGVEGEVGGGEGEVDGDRVREVDGGGMKDENGDKEGSLGEVDGGEEGGLEGSGAVCEVESVKKTEEYSGGEDVSNGKDENEVVEYDVDVATEQCAGELVVVEEIHSQDAAEVRNIYVIPSSPPPLCLMQQSWRRLLKEYDGKFPSGVSNCLHLALALSTLSLGLESEGQRSVSWADRCDSPPGEEMMLPSVLANIPRSPGRAITLHQRLSSVSRKRSVISTVPSSIFSVCVCADQSRNQRGCWRRNRYDNKYNHAVITAHMSCTGEGTAGARSPG